MQLFSNPAQAGLLVPGWVTPLEPSASILSNTDTLGDNRPSLSAPPHNNVPKPGGSLILRHMPSLDSLRGIAVLLVVLFHGFGSYNWLGTAGPFWGQLALSAVGCGRFGVNVFFVLSGFLITGILLGTRERPDYYRNFYIRRVLRVLPIYLLVLLILKLLHVIDFRFALAALLFLTNFSRLFGAPLTEYGVLWSLAVEEHFYLIWPFCVRRLGQRSLRGLLAVILVGEPLLRLIAAHVSAHIDIHYKTPFVLDFLAYGALLSILVRCGRIHAGNAARIGGVLTALGAALAVPTIWLSAFHNGPTVDALADLPFTWGACGILLLGLKRDHTRVVAGDSTTSRGFLPFYGYISYGLYLIHLEVYNLAKEFLLRHTRPGFLDNFAFFTAGIVVCIAISTGLAHGSRRYFEGPILGLKEKWAGRATPAQSGQSALSAD